ncbi:related to ankyrin [Fusarium fujikuroi IMI 58289]|uniref:Related to ankyrin n=1 Tax=Gibberella fujikuroi (strain CBS 195.34 / IMI 58289 / NRRL A-6831) TaxID=1279085 RepID=S0EMU8_GIBF5|nr:related to ankyrin [Fusarium fujikuroi IMI 58289]CCT73748.1 related to ankyrin [Fusarium fujikuroi IMI 58289]SCO09950.1 related to ankyrin [Fusarium fujikuroi]
MSFGFSVGDMLHLIELAQKTRRSFIDAPAQFRQISEEVRTLSNVLRDLEDVIPERALPEALSESLGDHVDVCTRLLEEIQAVLLKYHSLDGKNGKTRKTWRRIRWEPDDIKDMRQRLTSNIVLLSTINDTLNGHSLVKVQEGIDRLHDFNEDQEFTTITSWLSSLQNAAQHNDVLTRRHSGTGKWFLTSQQYVHWRESTRGTLFCPGLPGGGKTVIAASVIDDLLHRFEPEDRVGVAFIYCSYKRQHEQSVQDCMASLLKQLVQQLPKMPPTIRSLYRRHKNNQTRPSLDEIVQALQAVIDSREQVYMVVDALDEYSKTAGDLTNFLNGIFQLQSGRNINILATSRPNIAGVRRYLNNGMELEISAREEDVRQVLENAMPGMPSCISSKPALQKQVVEGIAKAVDGMFLLARLHLDSLRDKLRRKEVLRALENLPTGEEALNIAYTEAIDRIDSQRPGCRDLAKSVLTWISIARRPLTTSELRHALAIEPDETELDECNLPELEDMLSFCEGLVVADEKSNIISLVHYTTQEYLDQVRHKWLPNSHKEVALNSLAYLSYDDFAAGACESDSAFEHRLHKHVLLDYCAKNWGDHVRDAIDEEVNEAALEFLEDDRRIASAVQVRMVAGYHFQGYSAKVPVKIGAVHIAAQFGLTKIVSQLLDDDAEADVKDDFGRTPLPYAAEYGHKDTVELLMKHTDTDTDFADEQGRTPLSWAAGRGHVDVLKVLLNCPAVSANSKDSHSQSPLSWAARMGAASAVRYLITRNEVDKESRDRSGQTPLSWAAYNGHLEITMMLAESPGVDIDSKDDFSQTPLSWAAHNGHIGVVAYLLSTSRVSADTPDADNRTPLSWAAHNGHASVVRLLASRSDVNADKKDNSGQSPLSWAAREGHIDVVEFLTTLDDVQIHAADRRGNTALKWAAWNGYADIVLALEAKRQRGSAERRISLLKTEFETTAEHIEDISAPHVQRIV